MGPFQGHQVMSLVIEVFLCLWPVYLIIFRNNDKFWPRISRKMRHIDYFFIYCFALFIPNSTYAFVELRHLMLIDQIADSPNFLSLLVFGGIAIFGLVSTLVGNYLIVNHYAKNNREIFVYYLCLSLVAGFGTVVGLLDFTSISGLIIYQVLEILLHFIHQPILFLASIALSTPIFSIGYLPYRLFYKPS